MERCRVMQEELNRKEYEKYKNYLKLINLEFKDKKFNKDLSKEEILKLLVLLGKKISIIGRMVEFKPTCNPKKLGLVSVCRKMIYLNDLYKKRLLEERKEKKLETKVASNHSEK